MWDLSPHVGTEIHGVQLSQLDSAGLDELALLAAQRGALVFRDQDFVNIGFEAQKKLVGHFGPLHIHGWAPHPAAGSEEHMIIYDHKEYVRISNAKFTKLIYLIVTCVYVNLGLAGVLSSGIPIKARNSSLLEQLLLLCSSLLQLPVVTPL